MSDRYYAFDWAGESWARHAREQLKLFDEGKVEALFFAAFALRMGIEARLREYISAASKDKSKVKDYDARKLLAKLRERSPHAQKSFIVTFTPVEGGSPFPLTYTGITDALVAAHGKLSDLLHATFFRNNPEWAYRMPLKDKTPPSRSLTDIREWLAGVLAELDRATQGTLLSVGGEMFARLLDDEPGAAGQ